MLFDGSKASVVMKVASWLCDIHLLLKVLHGNEGAAKRAELRKYPFPQEEYEKPLKCVCMCVCVPVCKHVCVCGAHRLMFSAVFSHSPLNFLRQALSWEITGVARLADH